MTYRPDSRTKNEKIQLYFSIFVGVLAIVYQTYTNFFKDDINQPSSNYEQNLKALNDVQSSLKTIDQFVEKQKSEINQKHIDSKKLEERIKELEPLKDMNQQKADAIFKEQNRLLESKRSEFWRDGFIIGLISSSVATGFIYFIGYLYKKFFSKSSS